MIKKTEVFETSDGKFFEKELEAKEHENNIEFEQWYSDKELFGYTDRVPFADIREWLEDNWFVLKKFIEG